MQAKDFTLIDRINTLSCLIFPENNTILFWQDFRKQTGLPSNRMFYAKEKTDNDIVFIADGYGVLKNNKWDLTGTYGNGMIYIPIKELPSGIIEWCSQNLIGK